MVRLLALLLVYFFSEAVCNVRYETTSFWDLYELAQPKPLGTGAFGVVSLVRPRGSKFPLLAAKIIERRKKDQIINVDAELSTQELITCPFVPKIHRAFYNESVPQWILVMDYSGPVTLQSLEPRISSKTYKKEASGINIFIAANILLALTEIHKKKVFHRDLMAYNMIVSDEGYITVADFGNSVTKASKPQLDVDIERVCQIVYRFLMISPNRSMFPHVNDIRLHLRHYRHLRPAVEDLKISEFLEECILLKPASELLGHPIFNQFNWTEFEGRKYQSPLKEIVEQELKSRMQMPPPLK